MNINDHREDIRGALAEHFILWHPLNGPGEPGPRGEWRCDCGKKFGFSDTAISHQADALLASPALARLLAAARDEARAEVLRDARDALYRGEGPDLFDDSDIIYGEWLSNRADAMDGTR